jgi:hypothetical protein
MAFYLCILVQSRRGLPNKMDRTRFGGVYRLLCRREQLLRDMVPNFCSAGVFKTRGYGIERTEYCSPCCLFAYSDWVVVLFLEGTNSWWC